MDLFVVNTSCKGQRISSTDYDCRADHLQCQQVKTLLSIPDTLQMPITWPATKAVRLGLNVFERERRLSGVAEIVTASRGRRRI